MILNGAQAARLDHIQAVRSMMDRPMLYHIVTLGCQMNVRDSETIAGMLDEMGLSPTEIKEDADLILYNTCCVRENAENKALGNVMWLKELKARKPDLIICVAGCMMQESGMADRVKELYPFVDLAFGTHNMHRLPEFLCAVLSEHHQIIEVEDGDGEIREGLPVRRHSKTMAYVTVMYGCNNFCSFCIVPYVRGRERSRDADIILDEVRQLADSGVKEIMLLGQNVNSYGGGGAHFAELLHRLDKTGIERIRFMTSHPKDVSEELIACFGELDHLCRQIHLPVQSGNDRILTQMNRRYSRESYLHLVSRLRSVCSDVGLSGDIIVGFPGETEQEFQDTVSLAEQVRYDAAYTFIYSPRSGTRAARMQDDTPYEEKSRRIQRLIDVQQRITGEVLSEQVGKIESVLVESLSARDKGYVCGKTDRGHMVNFPGNESMIGTFQSVTITSAGRNTLRGRSIEKP